MDWKDLIKAEEARALVPPLPKSVATARLYLDGDYWQKSKAWAGTQVPLDAKDRPELENELERMFVPQPILEEVLDRHVAGVVGREPAIEFVQRRDRSEDDPILDAKARVEEYLQRLEGDYLERRQRRAANPLTFLLSELIGEARQLLGLPVEQLPDLEKLPEEVQQVWAEGERLEALRAKEDALNHEVNTVLASWLDARNVHDLAQEFAATLRTAGRACMRFWVPPGLLDANGSLGTDDWKVALSKIYLEAPAPESATVVRDRDTMQPVSVFVYKATAERNGKPTEVDRVEISYRNDEGQTVVRILEDDVIIEDGEAVQETGGELYVYEANLKPLLTVPVQRMQNALNVINSMILKNGDLAGFRERNYVNLQPPMKEVPDPKNPNQKIKVPDDIEVGARAANFLTGIAYTDVDGKQKLASGSVSITDPVSPAPLIKAKDTFERNIYQATSQLHVLISGDATASAVSRVQARADFVESLLKTKPKIEGVLRSRLQGALVLAAYLAGDTGHVTAFKALRCRVTCQINAGPLAPDERRALLEMYKARVVSLKTVQAMLGIEDVEAEIIQLRDEQEESQEHKVKQAEIAQAWAGAGAGIEPAARMAGVDDEDAAMLGRSDFVEGEDDAD